MNAGGQAPGFSTQFCDVEVDPETGKVTILRFVAAQDVGKAIHPSYVEGQIQGGVVQGIGWALNEEYIYNAKGQLDNPGFLDYRCPVASDLPMIDAVLVEVPNPAHPYGAKGVGEVNICPPMAAIANAIERAIGVPDDRAADVAAEGAGGDRRQGRVVRERGARADRLHHRLLTPLHRRRDGVPGGGEDPARRHPRDGPEVPGPRRTLEEETTVAIDGELYEIDFLRPIKPGAEVFFIPKDRGRIVQPLLQGAEAIQRHCEIESLPTLSLREVKRRSNLVAGRLYEFGRLLRREFL